MKKIFNDSRTQSAVLALALLIFIGSSASAQEQTLKYKILLGHEEIGWLMLNRKSSASSTVIKSTTEVKKRFVFLFTLSERQEATFQNGKLTRSYFFRKQNSTVKADKLASYTDEWYEIKKDSRTEKVMIPAPNDNLQSIYFHEPDNAAQVYSDNLQCLVEIKATGDNQYLIKIPGGSTNYYQYENGVCKKVKIEHTLFTVELILVERIDFKPLVYAPRQ